MMILADLTAGYEHNPEKGYYQVRDKNNDVFVGFQVADKYQVAKNKFCFSGADSKLNNFLSLGGMTHGHMMGTYYFLSNDYKDKLINKSADTIVDELKS